MKGATSPRARTPRAGHRVAGEGAWALAVAALAVAVYLPSLANGFARDDADLIGGIARWAHGLPALLASDFWAPAGAGSGLWRPLVTLSLWLDLRAGGGAPIGFHGANVLAHAATSALVFLVVAHAGVSRRPALLAAAWFAVMPAHTEAVAWVVGRTDVLAALFVLLAFTADRRERAGGKSWGGGAALSAYALALASKETAIALLPVLAAAEWTRRPLRPTASCARWLVPYAVVSAVWLALHALAARPGGLPVYLDTTQSARWPLAAATMLPRAAAFLWPWFAHTPDAAAVIPAGAGDPRFLLGAVITAALMATALLLAMRRDGALVPLTLWLAPVLVPMVVVAVGGGLSSGERLVYLASAGAAWLSGAALEHAGSGRARWPALAGMAGLIVASAWACSTLQPAWKDDASLYARMRAAQPDDPVGAIGLADVLAQQGRRADAERLFAEAERRAGGVPALHLARAALHHRYGEWTQVLAAADRALTFSPGLHDARALRANALLRLRRLDEADVEARALLTADSDDAEALGVRGQVLLLRGDTRAAAEVLAPAVAARPGDAGLWYALGLALAGGGDARGAVDAFARVTALDPRYAAGWLGLARAATAVGDSARARDALARAGALGGTP